MKYEFIVLHRKIMKLCFVICNQFPFNMNWLSMFTNLKKTDWKLRPGPIENTITVCLYSCQHEVTFVFAERTSIIFTIKSTNRLFAKKRYKHNKIKSKRVLYFRNIYMRKDIYTRHITHIWISQNTLNFWRYLKFRILADNRILT